MTTLLPLIIACLFGHTASTITAIHQGVANSDARAFLKLLKSDTAKVH